MPPIHCPTEQENLSWRLPRDRRQDLVRELRQDLEIRKTQEGCGGLRGENPGAFPKAGRFSSGRFLAGKCPTLAGIALRSAGKSVKNFPAASKLAGKLFQQGISDSHSLLECSDEKRFCGPVLPRLCGILSSKPVFSVRPGTRWRQDLAILSHKGCCDCTCDMPTTRRIAPPIAKIRNPPPPKAKFCGRGGSPAERTKNIQGANKIGAAISGPRISFEKLRT